MSDEFVLGVNKILIAEEAEEQARSVEKAEFQKLAATLFDIGANYIYQSGGLDLLNLVFDETKKILVGEHGEK